MRARLLMLAVVLLFAACAFPVEGEFTGRSLADTRDPAAAIVVIFNHGFSAATAGTYTPRVPPILKLAAERNPDVVLFSQVRNTSRLDRIHHASYVESAIEQFHRRHRVPIENIILVGQSCGGWASLQAAAFTYPTIGGVLVFAPTCHGRLPHSTTIRQVREQEIAHLAQRMRSPGTILVYEGDSYYELADWDGFEARAGDKAVALKVVRVDRSRVLDACPRCGSDSHGAVWGPNFSAAFFESEVQRLIERVRDSIVARRSAR